MYFGVRCVVFVQGKRKDLCTIRVSEGKQKRLGLDLLLAQSTSCLAMATKSFEDLPEKLVLDLKSQYKRQQMPSRLTLPPTL